MPLPVAALILAAGSAARMGRLKQLLPLGEKPVLRHSIDTLRDVVISEIVVVCGTDPGNYQPALAHSGVRLVPNLSPQSEMADSVRLGLGAIDSAEFSGILLCLADHPLVRPDTFKTLIALHQQQSGKIIIPSFQGRRGHPSLFPTGIINEIFNKASLRDVVRQDPSRVLITDVPDEGVTLDMDTEPDYRKAVALYRERVSRGIQWNKNTGHGAQGIG